MPHFEELKKLDRTCCTEPSAGPSSSFQVILDLWDQFIPLLGNGWYWFWHVAFKICLHTKKFKLSHIFTDTLSQRIFYTNDWSHILTSHTSAHGKLLKMFEQKAASISLVGLTWQMPKLSYILHQWLVRYPHIHTDKATSHIHWQGYILPHWLVRYPHIPSHTHW